MPHRAVLFLLLLAAAAHAGTSVPPAAQRYLDILKRRPQPGTIFDRFHSAWLEEGTAAGLLEHLTAAASRPDATAADHLVLALCHAHRGSDREALAAYTKALALEPKNASAWLERSRIEARLLDFESALKSLDQGAASNPPESLTLDLARLKGRVLVRLGRGEEAVRLCKELVEVHADDDELVEEVIDLFVDEGQLDAAIETSRALVGRSRDAVARTLRQLRLADILMTAERRDESLKILDTALAATGTDTWIEGDVLGRIERLFRLTDDIAGLEQHFATLLKTQPQRVQLAWQHALLLAATGQQEAALQAARTLLQSNPGRNDLREGFLDLLDSLDQTQEAVAQAQSLVTQNPQDKELLIRLAMLQHRAKDTPAAMATLEKFATLAAPAETDLLRVARILESWETPPARADSPASKAYQRLVSAFPDSQSAKEVHAHYLHRAGRRDEALKLWQELARTGTLEDLLRIAQALETRLEARPALNLLLSREREFAQQPRYLAQLVQAAIANEENERALPWALARLGMMRGADDIENALAPLRLILLRRAEKLAAPLIEKLQKQKELTVQDRCLLAMLLNERGGFAETVQLLTAAPEQDAVICLGELTRLHQTNRDWKMAAETLRKLIALPGNKTPARMQTLVDLLRRDNQPQEALKLITDWKAVAANAVEPWLVEAKVLAELYRGEEVLKLLKQAMRKFPDASEVANAYATACLNASQPQEAERVYLALYEKTTDTASRLRLLSPLALAAESHNALPKLIEEFQRRQRQNRASAYPWLALAEIHRAVRDEDGRLRCLYEASRLRPQDPALLNEIARCEEEAGLYPEAIRTLETAAKLDKTTRTRQQIARIQIENGDAEEGYRILFDLSSKDLMSADAIEVTSAALAAQGDWGRLITLLPPFLEKHPGHYRLHYLRAVALEESGREAEALAAFLQVMDIHQELPGTTAAVPADPMVEDLPAGAKEWMQMLTAAGKAYEHRKASASSSPSPLLPPVNGGSNARQVLLPEDVTAAPGFALVHVLHISSTMPESERPNVLRQLKRLGVSQLDLLFEAAQNTQELTLDAELLTAHPDDLALHAAWLLSGWLIQDSADLAVSERCFTLFEQLHPSLALKAAERVLRSDFADHTEAWTGRMVALLGRLPNGNAGHLRLVQSLLGLGEQGRHLGIPAQLVELDQTQIDSLVGTIRRWLLAEPDLDQAVEMTSTMISLERWDIAVEGFQHLIELASRPKAPQLPLVARIMAVVSPLEPAPLPVASFVPEFPPYIAALLDLMIRRPSAESEDDSHLIDLKKAMRERLPSIKEPTLALLLRLLSDETGPLREEWKRRVTRPEATLQDFLGMSWLLEREKNLEGALEHLQSARKLASDSALLDRIDSASLLLATELADKGESELASAAASPALERQVKRSASPPEKEQVASLMERFGLEDDAERLRQSLPKAPRMAPTRNATAITNPYSQALLQRGGLDGRDTLDRLLTQGNQAASLSEASRRMRQLVSEWHSQAGSDTVQQMTQLLLKLEMHQLRQPFLTTVKNNAATSWKARLEHAAVLSMQHAHGRVFQFNDGDTSLDSQALLHRALSEYEAVLAANPKADQARSKIVEMTATEDNATALRHWALLPEAAQHALLSVIIRKAEARGQTHAPLSAASLITSWLKSLDPLKRQPAWLAAEFTEFLELLQRGDGCPGLWDTFGTLGAGDPAPQELAEPLRRQRNDRRIAHDALCRALMRLPDLAHTGFAPFAGLAMFEGRNLEETADLALQLLASHESGPIRQRRATSSSPDSSVFETENRIPMPSPALFATWEAARRRDMPALESRVYPAILRSEGQAAHDFCQGYAEVVMAEDAQFPAIATAWVRKRVPVRTQDDSALRPGGLTHEILRLWRQRDCPGSLDELFIAYRDLNLRSADPFAAGPAPSAMDAYVDVTAARDPDAQRRFIHRLRDAWISPDAALRRRAIATFQENARLNRPHRNSPMERAAGRYLDWLARQMQSKGSLIAFEVALEDGAQNSEEWAAQITARGQQVETAGEFVVLMKALGCLDKDVSKLVNDTAEDQTGRVVQVVRNFRDSRDLPVVRDAVAQLGGLTPGTLTAHLVQALLVRDGVDQFTIGGQTVPLPSGTLIDNRVSERAAFRQVFVHHAAEIAALSSADRLKLAGFLHNEVPGLLEADGNDASLQKALAPIAQAVKEEASQRAAAMLAAQRWEDLAPNRGSSQTKVVLAMLRELAVKDKQRGIALARHAVALLKKSAEQQKAVAASEPETPADRFIMSLGHTPQLLGLTLALASENKLDQSITWCSSLAYRFNDVLKNADTALWALKDTPFVADAAGFRDWLLDDADEPTQICRIVTGIEKDPNLRSVVEPWLASHAPTLGTRLLTALLHRDAKEPAGLLSFYGQRPDPRPVVAFILKSAADLPQMAPEAAANLLVLLEGRLPGLAGRSQGDAKLQKALQPLIKARDVRFQAMRQEMLRITNLRQSSLGVDETIRRGGRLLDHLAPRDKPRALELLDHVSKLMAAEQLSRAGTRVIPPQQTDVAQWLQAAAVVPELFAEIMQRAEACGAAGSAEWKQTTLNRMADIHRLEHQPERLIHLLEDMHVLDPAATFTPLPVPLAETTPTLLETWIPALTQWKTLPPLLEKRPASFGTELLRLLIQPQRSDEAVIAFCQSHADEIAALPDEKKKVISALFVRLGWKALLRSQQPALADALQL